MPKKCVTCGCTNFKENPFAGTKCSNCLHDHDGIRVSGTISPKDLATVNMKTNEEQPPRSKSLVKAKSTAKSTAHAFKKMTDKISDAGSEKMKAMKESEKLKSMKNFTSQVSSKVSSQVSSQIQQMKDRNKDQPNMDISNPTDFKHDAHVGWDCGEFQIAGENVPSDWQHILGRLDMELKKCDAGGISEKETKELVRGTMRFDAPPIQTGLQRKGTMKTDLHNLRVVQRKLEMQQNARRKVERDFAATKNELEMVIAGLKLEIHQATIDGSGALAELNRLRMEITNERSTANDVREEITKLREANASLDSTVKALEIENQSLHSKVKASHSTAAEKEFDQKLSEFKSTMQSENTKLKKEVADLKNVSEKQDASLNRANSEIQRLKGEVQKAEKKIQASGAEAARKMTVIKNVTGDLDQSIATYQKEIDSLRQQLSEERALRDESQQLQEDVFETPEPPPPPVIVAPPPNAPPLPPKTFMKPNATPKPKANGHAAMLSAIRDPNMMLKHVSMQIQAGGQQFSAADENDMVKLLARALIDRRQNIVEDDKVVNDDDDEW